LMVMLTVVRTMEFSWAMVAVVLMVVNCGFNGNGGCSNDDGLQCGGGELRI
jgi:hypothetical protein